MARIARPKQPALGKLCRDKITGFTGIATAITTWLTGCTRFGLQPRKLDKEGKLQEAQWFDSDSLETIGVGVEHQITVPGGPTKAPQRSKDPRR